MRGVDGLVTKLDKECVEMISSMQGGVGVYLPAGARKRQ
jgi:hypothetical protein